MEPLLIVLTDGAGNVSIGALPPQEESYRFAELIAQDHTRAVVIPNSFHCQTLVEDANRFLPRFVERASRHAESFRE